MKDIQSVYAFKKHGWNSQSLLNWLLDHDIRPMKEGHIYGDMIRYRIKTPKKNQRYYTQMLNNGVYLVIEGQ